MLRIMLFNFDRWIRKLLYQCSRKKDLYPAEAKTDYDYSYSYQRKSLLSKNETVAYHKLKSFTDSMDYQLLTKVRLFDLLEPKPETQNYKGAQWKIQAKHLDFVICDREINVIVIVELDDSSHDRADRKQRDYFVDAILGNNGYKIFHTRNIDENCLLALQNYIDN